MTGQDVYELALALLDEIDSDGTINTTRTAIYAGKAPRLINLLQREIAHYDGTIITENITELTDTLEITDDSATRIMPYGLAAAFALADKNADMNNTYEVEYKTRLRTMRKPEQKIVDKYDILSGMKGDL